MSGRMRFLLVAIVGATLAFGAAGTAGAQVVCEPYGGGCTNPGGSGGSRSSGQISTVEVLPARGQAPDPPRTAAQAQLPVTGGDIAGLMIVASLLLGGGVLFVVIGRRRSPRQAPAIP